MNWPTVRDVLLFFLGAAGFAHEVLSKPPMDRPALLFLCGAMMALPPFLRLDDRRNGK